MSVTASVKWVETGDENLTRAAWEDHQLWVEFANGHAWRFDGVPRKFYTEMLAAANKSRYFRGHIMRRFEFERL